MTREEAIARIKDHKIIHKMDELRAIHISEALDMAIKALEQEPCEDCISRQAVLDIFAEKADTTRPYSEAWETVKKLPSVNPQKNIVNNGTMNITL